MIEQQRQQLEAPEEPEQIFAELPALPVQNNLIASVRIGEASLEVYSGADADVVAALWARRRILCKRYSTKSRMAL